MEQLPPPFDDLTITYHAQMRMAQRNISLAQIHHTLVHGQTILRGKNALHYDPATWVGVVVNWRARVIITVMNVWLSEFQREPSWYIEEKGTGPHA